MRDWRSTFMRETLGWMKKLSDQLKECGETPEVLTLYVNERTIAAVERRLSKLREVLAEAKREDERHKATKRMLARHARKSAR